MMIALQNFSLKCVYSSEIIDIIASRILECQYGKILSDIQRK